VPQLWTFPGWRGSKKDAGIEKSDENMCELCMEVSKGSALLWVSVAVPSLLVEMVVHAGVAS